MIEDVKLGEIAELKTGPFGTQLHANEYVDDGIPVINVRNIGYGEISTEDIDMVSEETVNRLSDHKLRENDIVFGRKGSIDRHAFIDKRYEGWMQGSDCIRVRVYDQNINPRYISHYLKLDSVKKQLTNGAVGSTMPSMNTDILKDIKILLPYKAEQDKVERVLTDIEVKIENNNDICTDLEAMAKLLYDYWFVQFDFPDENGKPYKSSGGKMEWNEDLKREIPEGWEVKSLNQLCSVVSGYPFNSDTYDDNGKYHVLTIKNIQDGYIATSTDSNVCCIPSDIPKCDILQSGDILMSLTGNVGRVGILCGDNYLLNQRASIILPKEESIKWFLYSLFRNESIFIQIQRVATGTSQKNVSPTDIGNIVVPYRKGIADNYNKAIGNSIQKMIVCNMENQQLASLRDFLLPMLMNGQVKVGEKN